MLAVITLDRVTKRYSADSVAVGELSFTVTDGELCVLVGPSGCGKTTTLRMINRLIEPSGGRILIDGTDVLKLDRELIKDIETNKTKKTIVGAFTKICRKIGVAIIAEGVETEKEYRWFKRIGVTLFQGYYFGHPAFESLSKPTFVG